MRDLDELEEKAKQGLLNSSEIEKTLFDFYDKVYPGYSDEPLVELFRGNFLKGKTSTTLNGLHPIKIQIFMILSSRAEFETKLSCLMVLF